MDRLTEYFELCAYVDKRNNIIDVSDKLPLFENGVVIGRAINKLAEFEDFMEEVGAESLNELENCIVDLKQENQALKDRWQKLKEWIKGLNNPIDNLVISDDETKYLYMSDVLDEMQELEEEG